MTLTVRFHNVELIQRISIRANELILLLIHSFFFFLPIPKCTNLCEVLVDLYGYQAVLHEQGLFKSSGIEEQNKDLSCSCLS